MIKGLEVKTVGIFWSFFAYVASRYRVSWKQYSSKYSNFHRPGSMCEKYLANYSKLCKVHKVLLTLKAINWPKDEEYRPRRKVHTVHQTLFEKSFFLNVSQSMQIRHFQNAQPTIPHFLHDDGSAMQWRFAKKIYREEYQGVCCCFKMQFLEKNKEGNEKKKKLEEKGPLKRGRRIPKPRIWYERWYTYVA